MPIDPTTRAFLISAIGDARSPRVRAPDHTTDLWTVAERFAIAPTVAARGAFAGADGARAMDICAETAALNALLLEDLEDTVHRLAHAGVPSVVLKGAALLADGVVEPATRHMDDADIIVPAPLRRRAHDVLTRAGFAAEHRYDRPGVDGRPISSRARVNGDDGRPGAVGDHQEAVLVTPRGTCIDLHYRFADARYGFSEIDAHARPARRRSALRVPRAAAMLGMLTHHVFVHHQARPPYVARHVADVRALLEHPDASIDDLDRADAWAPHAAVGYSVALVAAASGVIPGALAAALLAPLLPPDSVAMAYEFAWNAAGAWRRLRHDVRHRPMLVLRKIVPHRAYLEDRYDLSPEEPNAWPAVWRRLRSLDWIRGADA